MKSGISNVAVLGWKRDYWKALEWAYRLDYRRKEPAEDNAMREFQEETMKTLFSSHLLEKAEDS